MKKYRVDGIQAGIVGKERTNQIDMVGCTCYRWSLMHHQWQSQGQAEDLVLWHRYNYYVLGCALIPDCAYDAVERMVRANWSVSVCDTVGSSDPLSYPAYIRDGRRPLVHERVDRDMAIVRRWMNAL